MEGEPSEQSKSSQVSRGNRLSIREESPTSTKIRRKNAIKKEKENLERDDDSQSSHQIIKRKEETKQASKKDKASKKP